MTDNTRSLYKCSDRLQYSIRNNGHKEGQIFACKIFPSTSNSAKTPGGRRKKRHAFDVILAKDNKNHQYVLVKSLILLIKWHKQNKICEKSGP